MSAQNICNVVECNSLSIRLMTTHSDLFLQSPPGGQSLCAVLQEETQVLFAEKRLPCFWLLFLTDYVQSSSDKTVSALISLKAASNCLIMHFSGVFLKPPTSLYGKLKTLPLGTWQDGGSTKLELQIRWLASRCAALRNSVPKLQWNCDPSKFSTCLGPEGFDSNPHL